MIYQDPRWKAATAQLSSLIYLASSGSHKYFNYYIPAHTFNYGAHVLVFQEI